MAIDNKNLTNFTNSFFVPELASSLFDNAVKTLCAQAQARALQSLPFYLPKFGSALFSAFFCFLFTLVYMCS